MFWIWFLSLVVSSVWLVRSPNVCLAFSQELLSKCGYNFVWGKVSTGGRGVPSFKFISAILTRLSGFLSREGQAFFFLNNIFCLLLCLFCFVVVFAVKSSSWLSCKKKRSAVYTNRNMCMCVNSRTTACSTRQVWHSLDSPERFPNIRKSTTGSRAWKHLLFYLPSR